jgi:gamma-glutamylcyclotransferase (GGCT)/AIG2-like uncharacterized protein YtfP
MNKHFVFVYGTLRRGCVQGMSVRFPQSMFMTYAKVNGSLFDLGAYPGLVLDESDSMVTGEVYEVDDAILNELDEFESGSHYLRKQVEIPVGGHSKVCWTYEPDHNFYSFRKLIASGDWVEYVRTKG